jgi:hypothetical protein
MTTVIQRAWMPSVDCTPYNRVGEVAAYSRRADVTKTKRLAKFVIYIYIYIKIIKS